MKTLDRHHPLTIFIFFLAVILCTSIAPGPVILGVSCITGTVTFCVLKKQEDHALGPLFALCVLAGLINPLVSHRGVTTLFYMGNNPVTLEACIYGLFLTFQLFSLILWFKILSLFISAEHIMYLLGGLSPKLALLFSMTLRFVPEFVRTFKKTENAYRVQGRYKDRGIWEQAKGKSQVFLSVAGYSLEHGIVTAGSMDARGYSLPHRSTYHKFRLRRRDILLLLIILLLSAPLITSKFLGTDSTVFYPAFVYSLSPKSLVFIGLPGLILTLIPLFLHIFGEHSWKK